MRFMNKNENKIIIVACALTVIVVLGFTLMQGSVKSKENVYISKQVDSNKELKLTKEDYEIVKKDQKDNKDIFIILEKRNLTQEERASLVNIIGKDTNKKFEIYLFNNKEKADNFEYKTEQIQTIVKPIEKERVEVEEYYTIDKKTKDEPQYYAIKSIKENGANTSVEVDLKDTIKPEKALAQISFLGQSIKKLNPDKNLGNLEIKAYYGETKNSSWEYSSDNDHLIVHNQIVEI